MPVYEHTKESLKKCPKCGETKPIDKFSKVKGKVRSYCAECHRNYNYTNPDLRTEKQCSTCREIKLVSEFNRLGVRYQPHCRDCNIFRSRNRNAELKESGENVKINRRDYRLRRKWIKLKYKYGLTKEEYLQMVNDQKNLCAICGKPETETSSPHIDEMDLSVDHCHETGRVRGLLCRQCNIALGKFKEDVNVLKSAIEYLKRYS